MRVSSVDVVMPPMTTLARGRCTSAPAPWERAIGTKPRAATRAVIITGFKGRMGQALFTCAPMHPQLEVVGQIDQGDDLATVIASCDVVIDFSFHTATVAITELCARHKKALVVGTTGHDEASKSEIGNRKFPSCLPPTIPPA